MSDDKPLTMEEFRAAMRAGYQRAANIQEHLDEKDEQAHQEMNRARMILTSIAASLDEKIGGTTMCPRCSEMHEGHGLCEQCSLEERYRIIRNWIVNTCVISKGDIGEEKREILKHLDSLMESCGTGCQPPRGEFYDNQYGITPAQYHQGLAKLWNALGITEVQNEDVFTLAAREIERSRPPQEPPDVEKLREALDWLHDMRCPVAEREENELRYGLLSGAITALAEWEECRRLLHGTPFVIDVSESLYGLCKVGGRRGQYEMFSTLEHLRTRLVELTSYLGRGHVDEE